MASSGANSGGTNNPFPMQHGYTQKGLCIDQLNLDRNNVGI